MTDSDVIDERIIAIKITDTGALRVVMRDFKGGLFIIEKALAGHELKKLYGDQDND